MKHFSASWAPAPNPGRRCFQGGAGARCAASLLVIVCAAWTYPCASADLAAIETAYADLNDALGAIGLIDSGAADRYEGRSREAWLQIQTQRREQVATGLAAISQTQLSAQDERAVTLMRKSLESLETAGSMAPVGRCQDARGKNLEYEPLRTALYACFGEYANDLDFEGAKVTRVAAFDLLTRMDEPQRRKKLFMAFLPLWNAINGNSEADSAYRRPIALAARQARATFSAAPLRRRRFSTS